MMTSLNKSSRRLEVRHSGSGTRRGVSLIITLGVLAVFTLMVTAMLIVTRSDRRASRAFADNIRAKHLLHAAVVNAIEDINVKLASKTYPDVDTWTSGAASPAVDLLKGDATNFIPRALWTEATSEAPTAWINLVQDGVTNGRIAYMIVNCSGLLDANIVGGKDRTESTSVEELDLSGLIGLDFSSDLSGTNGFFAQRNRHYQYESIWELGRINGEVVKQPYNLFTYSYDPGRDQYYTNISDLGSFEIDLYDKFHINDTNSSNYFDTLLEITGKSGLANPDALTWNMINYIDEDRIPQSDEDSPELSNEISEAVPLVNEISLERVDGQPTNHYAVSVELWFPFHPATVSSNDNFTIEVDIYTNSIHCEECSFDYSVGSMTFGNPGSEFLIFSNQPGEFIVFPNPSSNGPAYLPVSSTNQVWCMARVLHGGTPVDQAPGTNTLMFTGDYAYSVDDPRMNGSIENWDVVSRSIGSNNWNCTAWADEIEGQGLPIFHRDGPMVTIGEVGHIFHPGSTNTKWRNINILSPEGAFLLDRLTVRATNPPACGLVSMNSAQTNVLGTLFHGVEVGYTNEFKTASHTLDMNGDPVRQITSALGKGFYSFENMFEIDGVSNGFQKCASSIVTNGQVSDIIREAPLRNIVEMVTWRQNIFTVIVASQALGRDGETPVAEKRGIAVVYRDAYTGKSFIKSFRLLAK